MTHPPLPGRRIARCTWRGVGLSMPFTAVMDGRNSHPPAEMSDPGDDFGDYGSRSVYFVQFIADMLFHVFHRRPRVGEFAITVAIVTVDRALGVIFFGAHELGPVDGQAATLAKGIAFHAF